VEVKQIQQTVNGIIVKNVPITVSKMSRKDAEEKFGTALYDLIKPSEDIQELNILQIPDWNTNAVKDGAFLTTTGELNAILVDRLNFRPQKTHVEFCFEIVPSEDKRSDALRGDVLDSTPAATKTTTTTTPTTEGKKSQIKPVSAYSEELVEFFFQQLEKHGDSAEARQSLRRSLLEECTVTLNSLQNTSFAAGYKVGK